MKIKLNLRDQIRAAADSDNMLTFEASVDVDNLFETAHLPDECDVDLDDILEQNRMIAHIWTIDDVHETRPDLTDEQAWEVLKACDRNLDSEQGISWETIEAAADKLCDAAVNRAERFGKAIEDYTDDDAKINLVDLLADAAHWCRAKSVSFDEALETARTHFAAETQEGERP